MLINTREQFDELLSKIDSSKMISVDLETTGLDPYKDKDRLCGVSVSMNEDKGFYVPFRHEHPKSKNVPLKYLPILFDHIRKVNNLIFFNAKFDMKMLMFDDIDLRDCKFADVMLMMHTYNENASRHSLKYLAYQHVDVTAAEEQKKLKKLMQKLKYQRYSQFLPEELESYASKDALLTFELFEFAKKEEVLIWCKDVLKIEHDLVRALIDVENHGVKIDIKYIKDQMRANKIKVKKIEEKIFEIAGKEFDILSSPQLTEVMNSLGIHSTDLSPKTQKEKWSTPVLLEIKHPISPLIREYRSRTKLMSTYLEPFLEQNIDGIIHTNFNQVGARTGRFSCTTPPLQTIPRHSILINEDEYMSKVSSNLVDHLVRLAKDEAEMTSEEETLIRKCFIPRDGYTLVVADYSQMEAAIFAEMSKDEKMIEMSNNDDLHSVVSEELFGKTDDVFMKKMNRQISKHVQFGILYGMGYRGMANMLKKDVEEAKRFVELYKLKFPGVGKFQKWVQDEIKAKGYVKTYYGRPRHLEFQEAYKGVNSVIQGTCADIMKVVLINLNKFLSEYKSNMLTTVHDEIMFEIHNSEMHLIDDITRIMTDLPFRVKLRVTVKTSDKSWADCKEVAHASK